MHSYSSKANYLGVCQVHLLDDLLFFEALSIPLRPRTLPRRSGRDVIDLDNCAVAAPERVLIREYELTAWYVCGRAIALLEKNSA